MAEQQGKYLAKQLNIEARAQKAKDTPPEWMPFKYRHLGSMALVGKAEHRTSCRVFLDSEELLVCCNALKTYSSCLAFLSTHLRLWESTLL